MSYFSEVLWECFLLPMRNRPPPAGGRLTGGGFSALLPGDLSAASPPGRWPVSLSAQGARGCLSALLSADP